MEKIRFAPVVMLVDAAYLGRVGRDMAAHFGPVVGRELPKADLAVLLECLALDAGIQGGENEIQVIFVYDALSERMDFCEPSGLAEELHGVAFKGCSGEFSLYSFQTSGMASREDLFMEALELLGESKEVSRMIAVPDEEAYGSRVDRMADGWKKADCLTVFGMNPPSVSRNYRFEMMGFAVLQSLGIRADEL